MTMQTDHSLMIVDDDPLIRDRYRNLLEAAGFSVVQGSNGADALIWLLEETVDLIIIDLGMPVMDARSFLECRLRYEKVWNIPLVVVSAGFDDVGIRQIPLRLGANRLLEQAIDREHLVDVVRGLLAKPRTRLVSDPVEARHVGAREDGRLTFSLPIHVHTRSSGEISGTLRDLSTRGVGAYLPRRLHEWEPITISLTLGGRSLTLRGYVQWFSKHRRAMSYRYGIQFTERQLGDVLNSL